ncbi:MAG: hypothetical protein ABSD10_01990 [Candidatus Saccharimonadales bacterium]|jgi:Tfp pilus assembly major pilin PilA
MTKLKKNKQGFGVVEILLVLIIVVLLGVVGWMVYKNHHKATTSTTAANSSAPSKTAASPTKTATPAVNYFTISQWSVRAPYSGSLTLQYQPDSSSSNRMNVSSAELNAGGPSMCTTAAGAAGYIGKYLPTDNVAPESPTPEAAQEYLSQDFAASNTLPPAYSKVGNYYYIYFDASNECDDTALQTQTTQDFANIVNHLTAY